jgi:hypothetical protein
MKAFIRSEEQQHLEQQVALQQRHLSRWVAKEATANLQGKRNLN